AVEPLGLVSAIACLRRGYVLGGRRATVRVRLTKQGLRRLRRLRRLDVRLIATSSSLSGRGAPVRGKVRLVPRRRSPRPA
ncbi:MAG: hypothetical protein WKF29_07460, partial [Thermoleophilaceae bacterium]